MTGGRRSAALSALLLIAACTPNVGPSPTRPSATTTSSSTPATTVPPELAVSDYETCLSNKGLDIGPIPFDATGRPRLDLVIRNVDFADPDHVEALSGCAEHLTAGALDLGMEPVLRALVMSNLVEFSACVRSHGVPDFPDPLADFNGIGNPYLPAELPYDEPDLSSAVETCRARLADLG